MRSVVRVEHDKNNPFVMVSVDTIRDTSISFESRGFLIFLLAKPDECRVRPEQIAEECGLHRATVYRMLNVLIKEGYVYREIITRRKPDGTFDSGSIYTVHEKRLEHVPF
jgi:hypothetical protein